MSRRPTPTWPTLLFSAIVASAFFPNVLAQDNYWDTSYDSGGGRGGGLFGDSNFSYGYFDLGYISNDFDQAGTAGGVGGELSIPLINSLFVKSALSYASPSNLDYLAWELGGGIGLPITGNLDIVIEAGLAHQKLEGDLLSRPSDAIDGYGYYVSPSVRFALGEIIELDGGVIFRNVDSDSEVAVDLKAFLLLTSGVSIWGGVLFSEEVNQYGVGLRLSF